MESDYKFITMHTLVDIGNGIVPLINDEGELTTTANLSRIVDTITRISYPFMTTISKCQVDFSKDKNKIFYRLGTSWIAPAEVYTFKFAVKTTDSDISNKIHRSLDGVPVVIVTDVNNTKITRFITDGNDKNITIIENKFV